MAPAARVALGGRFALSLESVCGLRAGVVGRGVETCDRCERREEERIAQSITFRTMCFRGANQRHVMMTRCPRRNLKGDFMHGAPGDGCQVTSCQVSQELKSRQVKSSASTLFLHSVPKLSERTERCYGRTLEPQTPQN
jgi:hypothetical protein